jgi:2-succinyl-6-hydroxy-2,4-cyclohexadiene-1-carboxylate synthase
MKEGRLHYTVSGPAGAPVVVFLHGFMGDHRDWGDVTGSLDQDFLCVCIDLPGHGGSRALGPDSAYTFEAACAGVGDVLDQLGCAAPACVGYSMGGRVALGLAAAEPTRFGRLLVESASPGLEDPVARRARIQVDEERARSLERGQFERFLEAWYANPLFGSLAARPGLRHQMIRDRLDNDPRELARALRGMSTGRQASFWDRLPWLDLPVLVLAGSLDPQYADAAPRMADLCPSGQARIVLEAGHNIHREQPDLFLDAARTFLEATGEHTRGND